MMFKDGFHGWWRARGAEAAAETARDLARVALVTGAAAIPVAILLFHVHNQYEVVRSGYDIAEVTREHKRLAEDNKKLRIEAAVQGRAGRVTQLARERFGLEPTRPEQIHIIEIVDSPAPVDPGARADLAR